MINLSYSHSSIECEKKKHRRLESMNILVINAGSSSLKYQLMDPDTGVVTA